MGDLAAGLDTDLKRLGKNYPVTTRVLGYCTVKFASYFIKDLTAAMPLINRRVDLVNTASIEVLGIQYNRTIREFVLAAALSLI